MVGIALSFLGGSTNYFLWYNINFPPYGNILASSYVILTAFAILKYHLFNIKVIATELLVGLIGIILVIQAFAAETILMKIFGFSLFLSFSIVGYFLIKSVLREIELREELEAAYKELERLDKAKSEFVSIASHQLRTPLTAIKGYISILLEGTYGKLPQRAKKPIENVFKSNERLIRLVNDLLSISRIESGKLEMKRENFSLEEVIISIIDELKIKAKDKNIYVKRKKPSIPLPEVKADKNKIRQVILNIIDNAIRYTEKGGITIKSEIEDLKVKIIISDTGEGMTNEEISYLFESFSRGRAGTKLWTEGAGLGLYIAKKFVETHKGKIWAESEGKEKGSTFYIELPTK